jgi:putative transposase
METEFVHVTTRGHRRQTLLHDEKDFRRLPAFLATAVDRYGWRCHSYCFIPNHFHLLLEFEAPALGRGMLMSNGSYARYFNWRYQSEGHVFERKHHREPIAREEHFLECFRYIALNPVKAGLCDRPEDWPWSSYRATAGLDVAPRWLEVDFARELFLPYGGYAEFCNQIASA